MEDHRPEEKQEQGFRQCPEQAPGGPEGWAREAPEKVGGISLKFFPSPSLLWGVRASQRFLPPPGSSEKHLPFLRGASQGSQLRMCPRTRSTGEPSAFQESCSLAAPGLWNGRLQEARKAPTVLSRVTRPRRLFAQGCPTVGWAQKKEGWGRKLGGCRPAPCLNGSAICD